MMNPVHVAELLKQTEADWVDLALTEQSTQVAESKMISSCGEIVDSMVKSSDGERSRVSSYFEQVCGVYDRDQERDEHGDKAHCQIFRSFLLKHMSDDSGWNRDRFDSTSACTDFWNASVSSYVTQAHAERAENARRDEEAKRIAAEKKAKEEEKKNEVEKKKRVAENERIAKHEAEMVKKMNAAKKDAKAAQAQKDIDLNKSSDAVGKGAASLKKTEATKETVQRSTGVVVNRSHWKSEGTALSIFANIEGSVKDCAGKVFSYLGGLTAGTTTMADTYTKENHAEPTNHSVYQSAAQKFQTKAVQQLRKMVENSVTSEEKRRGTIAQKVESIKQRIAGKFENVDTHAAVKYA